MFAALNSFLTGGVSEAKDPYWANVSMLLHGDGTNAAQNNTFLDGSTNNFTVTRNGNTTQGSFNPFVSTYPYAVATNGGSGYFDGTGDYLTVPDSTAFTLGTNDFTVEAWIYATTAAQGAICGQTNAAYATANTSIVFSRLSDGRIDFFAAYNSGSSLQPITTLTAPLNTWTHVAAVRDGATLRVYVGGVQSATATISTGVVNDSASLFAIGRPGDFAGQYFPGYISNLRLVNGTCLYPSGTTFTPPTAPLTAVTNTALLLGMSNGAIFDNTMLNNLETVANAQINTSVFKYGTGSVALNGTTDYLNTSPANQNSFAFGSGDFTIEMWVYATSVSGSRVIYDSYPTSTGGFYPSIQMALSGQIFYNTNTTSVISGGTLSTNTWYHIAVCRSGTSTKLFINGTQSGSTYTDSNVYLNSSLRPYIGASGYTGAAFFPGYIDDLRVTKGIARYTTTFTPPTAAFPNSGP